MTSKATYEGLASQLVTARRRMDSLYQQALKVKTLGTEGRESKTFQIKYRELEKWITDHEKITERMASIGGKPETFKEEDFQKGILEFEDIATEIKLIYEELFTVPEEISSTNGARFQDNIPVHLPKISIPTFNGAISEWTSFFSLYNSLVGTNKSLTDVEKLQYLRASLKGEALDLIKNLDITSESYYLSLKLLQDRYENVRKIATVHAQKILNLPVAQTPSAKSLHSIISTYREHIGALQALEVINSEHSSDSFFLFLILIQKVDSETRCNFERSLTSNKDVPTVEQLITFLEKECLALEASGDAKKHSVMRRADTGRPITSLASKADTEKCVCCDKDADHRLHKCSVYLKMKPIRRKQFVMTNRLCFNCLSSHTAELCTSEKRCYECKGKHHTTLHIRGYAPYKSKFVRNQSGASNQEQEPVDPKSHSESTEVENFATSHTVRHIQQSKGVVLSTVVIGVQNGQGKYQLVRAVLDTGSQSTYITTECARRLRLPRYETDIKVLGLGQNKIVSRGGVSLHISHRNGGTHLMTTEAVVIDKITGQLPTIPLPVEVKRQLGDLTLADPNLHIPGPIDCLLGADVFAQCLQDGRMELGAGKPTVLNTIFGWVLMGCMNNSTGWNKSTSLVAYHSVNVPSVDSMLQKFWTMEEPVSVPIVTAADKFCENHYVNTHTRKQDGSYMVKLPFKPNSDLKLGVSYGQAESRFLALERRLVKTPDMYNLYRDCMQDYISAGHMEECEPPSEEQEIKHYFMPHHGVYKSNSSTTKLRVVFDASSPTTSNSRCSLNEILVSGPKLHKDLIEILIHFRLNRVAMTADVKQMYRRVWVDPADRNYQLILWRNSNKEDLKTYRLNTVTFGVTSSPFLAMRSLLQLVKDEGSAHPLAAKALSNDIFVDDVVTGAPTVQECLELQDDLIKLLSKGSFQLRKWASNEPAVLSIIPEEDRETPVKFISDEPLHEVLGIGWHTRSDSFVCSGRIIKQPHTKRGVLSSIARFYDPLGLLTPVTIWAKTMLQKLWIKGLDWDTPLPLNLMECWARYEKELPELSNISFSRYLVAMEGSLHGFSDASEQAYAAVVYYVPYSSENEPHLLLAKSKVAPLKQVSIPRLELCAAHLLAKLLFFLHATLKGRIHIHQTVAWSDSTTALAWIRSSPHLLKTFVANRVSEIQQWVAPEKWKYVSSTLNPADCASRGLYPSQLINHDLWFRGPPFITEPSENWPSFPQAIINPEKLLERKTNPLNNLLATQPRSIYKFWERCSSWIKLIRSVAYLLRFVNNSLKRGIKRSGCISVTELRSATTCVLRCVQGECFKQDLGAIQQDKCATTRLQRLHPFVDAAGLLRVGGRLDNANVCFSFKHPILLPSDHHVTNLLIDHFHVLYLHAGPQLLHSMINRQYWILSGRSAIRKRIYRCVTCFRHRPVSKPPLMASLPDVRVNPARTFAAVSLDFAGPVLGRTHRRSVARCKMYLCIFVCCCTKAVHIEVVSALSTEAFLAAFQRFTSRRGLPMHVYSDQGTNFVGADNEIRKLFKYFNSSPQMESLADFATQNQIAWHFQPPAAPHFGGLHEAAVKQTKHHLRRVMGSQILTYEELSTLACRIEAALNSRPLCPLSEDPSEFDALTPGHFLCGAPLLTLPDPRTNITANTRMRWRMVQEMSAHFWRRWSQEYLHTLIQRSKWYKSQDNIPLGALVLLKEDGLPPQCWKLGRITKAEPSKDGVVRVVKVRTAKGELTRPVVKVFPLPVC